MLKKLFKTILEFFNLKNMPINEIDLLKQKIASLEKEVQKLQEEMVLQRKAKIFQKFLGRELSDEEKKKDIFASEEQWTNWIQGSVEHKKLVSDIFRLALGREISENEYNQFHKTRTLGNLIFTILKSAEFLKRISEANLEANLLRKKIEEAKKALE